VGRPPPLAQGGGGGSLTAYARERLFALGVACWCFPSEHSQTSSFSGFSRMMPVSENETVQSSGRM
jgi:hypothetical protein